MMDLATLIHVNRQAARRSANVGKVPLILDQRDIDDMAAGADRMPSGGIPYIGDRAPKGWRPSRPWNRAYSSGTTADNRGTMTLESLDQEIEYVWRKIEVCSRLRPLATEKIRAHLNRYYYA